MRATPSRIAIAIHDIEPATFERCALIRDWLHDHGVGRVTLLVIPARDLHPLAARSPEMVSWLLECERRGDVIAQHGFQHLRRQRPEGAAQLLDDLRTAKLRNREEAEFVGLDAGETRRAVDSGRRLLKLAGIEPQGFVAPAYAYTPALRRTVSERFAWWAELMRVRRSAAVSEPGDEPGGELLFPPLAIASSGPVRRLLGPALLRAGSVLAGDILRVDLHPSDLDSTRRMLALEWVMSRSGRRREAVTYADLVGSPAHPSGAALARQAA